MFGKYRNRYRIASARLPGWDYGRNGFYFITICTHRRQCFFGKLDNGHVNLSVNGQKVFEIWNMIPDQFPYVHLDEMIIMPDHLHGVLQINHPRMDVETKSIACLHPFAPTDPFIATHQGGFAGHQNPMLCQNIPRIIRWFKGRCKFEIHKFCPEFAWQPRYHDHVIRNRFALIAIRMYIRTNPIQKHTTVKM